ncbi:hypothetical protein PCCS19_04120 [Paenibacillus sp. CCS19]|uniref:S-layer homology domain-containing protein n=1 Tax=Paenibacillus sp. CCS19 TaxID=3158387 RepID=UPI00255FE356|nr:S-layer homology domain-containing protein [Paenibacillus cellulosilyticus]GMK37359.1 hypothetical protein PCCS19_04120 [Paenibacillus cellulosilyticus]
MKLSSKLRRTSARAALKLLLVIAVFITSFTQAFQVYAEVDSVPASRTAAESMQDTSSNTELADVSSPTTDPLLTEVQTAIEGAAQSMLSLAKIGDWQAVGLSKAGKKLPSNYAAGLYKTLVANKGTFTLVTDYERTVIGLTAAHQDATKFAGYNLIEKIYNNARMTNQGLNGPLYGLIALDSGRYAVPADAVWTREKLVAAIIALQKADGGFALGGGASDPDITAMTLTALSPYAGQADAQAAIGKAVEWLSLKQQANGGYLSWGADASESVAQAIIGLTSQGIDPTTDRFTKNGVNLVQKLLSFRLANGTFSHTPGAASNGMATEQALQALLAYNAFKSGGNRLYDFGTPQTYGWPAQWILGSSWSDTEWQAVAIARAGLRVPDSYLSTLPSLAFIKESPEYAYVTDYERLVIALSALRQDAADYDGMNLVERIYNSDIMENQGTNGLVFALIALDSGEYTTPSDAKWDRTKLLKAILDRQKADGGFALNTGASDPDVTAMTLTALASYMSQADVKTAGDRAVEWLSLNQQANGGYLSWGTDSSESVSQAIIALTSNGIDPTSAKFTKNGITLLDKLFSFYQSDGGFSHVIDPQAASDAMATEQAQQALTAYEKFVRGEGRLYQMGKPLLTVSIQVEGPQGPIAEGSASGTNALAALQNLLSEKQVPIAVTDSSFGKYVSAINNIVAGTYGGYDGWMFNIYRAGKWIFPSVGMDAFELKKNDRVVVYYTGSDTQMVDSIQVTPAEPKAGESFTVAVTQVTSVWNNDAQSSEIVKSAAADVQVKIGGTTVTTNNEGIATFSGGFAQAGTYTVEVTGYVTDQAPNLVRSTKPLVIAPASTTNPGNGGSITSYVTLSVNGDSQKGTILASKQVALQAGDTAFTVLARELPGKIRYEGSGAAIYVQGIDGLSEFDRGPDSGWMYAVNGIFPNHSAGIHTLHANDVVAWRYTKDLGCDLGACYTPGTGTGTGAGAGTGSTTQPGAVIDVPKDLQKDYELKPTKEQASQPITLNIPDVQHKIVLNTEESTDGLPQLTANKGNLTLSVEQGTKILSGQSSLELFTGIDPTRADLLKLINGQQAQGTTVNSIMHAFLMGAADSSYTFDRTLTLTIKGAKGQLAGFIQNQSFTQIKLFASDEEGKKATAGKELITYAYLVGDDLIIKTNHFTSFVTYTTQAASTEVELSALFSDAKQVSAWAVQSIEDAVQKGFVQGSGGKLSPKGSVTRAEFTKLMAAVLKLEVEQSATTSFKDIQPTAWYSPYVEAAYKAGFITGYNGEFKPNDTLTREQMAVMIVRAFGVEEGETSSTTLNINDINQVSSWAQSAVKTSLALQWMNGVGSKFDPAGTVTREMAFVVAMRSYDYKSDGTEQELPAVEVHKQAVEKQIARTAQYLLKSVTNPTVSTLGGEWTVLGLARSGEKVPASWYNTYYANLEKTLKEKEGNLHSVKYTEYDRVILALSALGRSVDDVAGYNLLEKLADFDTLIKQGINGPIFALIALDSNQYEIPIVKSVSTQTTREGLIRFILNRQIAGGGWALGENATAADADVTGMAIQALAPYYTDNADVKAAVNKALAWLSAQQQSDGGFASNDANNVESAAQVIVALTSLGINPHTDTRFVKNGHSVVDALMSFAAAEGGFYHIKAGGNDNGGAQPGMADPMAADQAMYALVAYDRLLGGKTSLYDMTDVK